jgi:hypothetical protein
MFVGIDAKNTANRELFHLTCTRCLMQRITFGVPIQFGYNRIVAENIVIIKIKNKFLKIKSTNLFFSTTLTQFRSHFSFSKCPDSAPIISTCNAC